MLGLKVDPLVDLRRRMEKLAKRCEDGYAYLNNMMEERGQDDPEYQRLYDLWRKLLDEYVQLFDESLRLEAVPGNRAFIAAQPSLRPFDWSRFPELDLEPECVTEPVP